MHDVKFFSTSPVPLEMHRTRITQEINLPSLDERLSAIHASGFNTYLLHNRMVYLDMLTDSGVNAMSNAQQAAMLLSDDAYAGSETFERLQATLQRLFGMDHFLPVHQGRAAEHLLARAFVTPGSVVPTNVLFTTTAAHVREMGGMLLPLPTPEATDLFSTAPFKGNMGVDMLREFLRTRPPAVEVPFVRMEAGANLIGGQPFSISNLKAVSELCRNASIPLVMDASLLSDNLYFILTREATGSSGGLEALTQELASYCDIIYFSGRKLGLGTGGGILLRSRSHFELLRPLIPLYEGFLTYGGMSSREMEALRVGFEECLKEEVISQGPRFIAFLVEQLTEANVPVLRPPGGVGAHLDGRGFLPHLRPRDYPAAALAAALYIVSGVRGLDRGTLSQARDPEGNEVEADLELVRLAVPRRSFSLSHMIFVADRVKWLHRHAHLVGPLEWVEEPPILRFFYGRLAPRGEWHQLLAAKLREDLGDMR